MDATDLYHVIIVGGGPAGLSAALLLGRCRRKVLVIDAGNPRNARSHAMHGFLSRDGTHPGEFLKMAREEVKRYGVKLHEGTVMCSNRQENGFEVQLLDESKYYCRKLLLATGVVDRLPNLENIEDFYGRSVHHCPYCDGWEHSDEPIAVYGKGKGGTSLALTMRTWSRDILLCTDGNPKLSAADKLRLSREAIEVNIKPIRRLTGSGGKLASIVFEDGTEVPRRAMFFSTGNVQRSALPEGCGCALTPKGAIKTSRGQKSTVSGIWVCGDAAEDTQYVIVAAAEGAKAAMAINREIQNEDQS